MTDMQALGTLIAAVAAAISSIAGAITNAAVTVRQAQDAAKQREDQHKQNKESLQRAADEAEKARLAALEVKKDIVENTSLTRVGLKKLDKVDQILTATPFLPPMRQPEPPTPLVGPRPE